MPCLIKKFITNYIRSNFININIIKFKKIKKYCLILSQICLIIVFSLVIVPVMTTGTVESENENSLASWNKNCLKFNTTNVHLQNHTFSNKKHTHFKMIIVTGKIIDIINNPLISTSSANDEFEGSTTLSVIIYVKRVIKGDHSLQNLKLTISSIFSNNLNKFCVGRLRINDTRIFFIGNSVSSNDHGFGRNKSLVESRKFIFLARPIHLTLKNLKLSSFLEEKHDGEDKVTTLKPPSQPSFKTLFVSQACSKSLFGCCPDKITSALGLNYEGCFTTIDCKCNKLGSISNSCDSTLNCVCRPGVGGKKCDRCLPRFWGLPRIVLDGQQGCTSCYCSLLGSIRDDCEQMTGKCECKLGVWGHKCDRCIDGQILKSDGCMSKESSTHESKNAQTSEVEPNVKVRFKHSRFNENLPKQTTSSDVFDTKSEITSSGMKSTRHISQPQSNYHDIFRRNFFTYRSPTSATVQIKSYLGEFCQSSLECVTSSSVCHDGICVCKDGYYEDSERIQCRPINSHVSNSAVCDYSFCHHSSTCFGQPNGSFHCLCAIGTSNVGLGCSKEVNPFPFFNGQSTILFGKLAGFHKLSIEVEITPYNDFSHGTIVFSSQYSDGSGDFLSLALIDGFVEFRYDLGDGFVKLRSNNRLKAGTSYFIAAKRYNRDGLLQVDDEVEVKGSSGGEKKSLNLGSGGHMGFIPLHPTKIWEIVGTSQGFIGCVHKLIIGRRPIDFTAGMDPLINSTQNVYQCLIQDQTSNVFASSEEIEPQIVLPEELSINLPKYSFEKNENVEVRNNSCSTTPCMNNGHCWIDHGQINGFKCVCHPDYSGATCESKRESLQETGAMIDFRGFSYLELPKIDHSSRHLSIEIWIMPRSRNGLIFYNGQYPGTGDYIALNILNGHIQFLFDFGSGMGNLTWHKRISLNKWHWIYISRDGREAKLQVDGESSQKIKSPPSLSELNLELPLYLGGISDINMIHRELETLPQFNGVFQYLKVNDVTYHKEIMNAIKERQVHKYEGPPCGSSITAPCSNGGTCFPRLSSFACVCPSAYSGKTCEHRQHVPGPVLFNGQNFLTFPSKVTKSNRVHRKNQIEIVFRTSSTESGVLIWTGNQRRHSSSQRGYIGVFLADGHPELRVDLGPPKNKKPVIIRSKIKVTDGRWHQILISRRRRFIVFQIDGFTPQRMTAPVGSNTLHTDGRFWIGGVESSVLPNEIPAPFHSGFRGCVDIVRIEKRRLPLSKLAYATGNPFCEGDD